MTQPDFSDEALETVKLLAKGPGSIPPGPIWDELTSMRFIMGDHARTHITSQGKSFALKLGEN